MKPTPQKNADCDLTFALMQKGKRPKTDLLLQSLNQKSSEHKKKNEVINLEPGQRQGWLQ